MRRGYIATIQSAQFKDNPLASITPKSNVSREQRLKVLGETLKGLSPKDRADAIRVASNLLARKINKTPRPGCPFPPPRATSFNPLPTGQTRLAQPQSREPPKLYWEPTAEEEAGVNSLPSQGHGRLKLAPSSFNQRVDPYLCDAPLDWD